MLGFPSPSGTLDILTISTDNESSGPIRRLGVPSRPLFSVSISAYNQHFFEIACFEERQMGMMLREIIESTKLDPDFCAELVGVSSDQFREWLKRCTAAEIRPS